MSNAFAAGRFVAAPPDIGVPFPVWYPLDDAGEIDYNNPVFADRDSLPLDPQADTAPGYKEDQRDQHLFQAKLHGLDPNLLTRAITAPNERPPQLMLPDRCSSPATSAGL